jgi:hypothetical protein
MSDDRNVTASLTVYSRDRESAVRMMETLNRVMLGLAFDGFDVELSAGLEPDYYGDAQDYAEHESDEQE